MQITVELPDKLVSEFLHAIPETKQQGVMSALLTQAISQQLEQCHQQNKRQHAIAKKRSDIHPVLSQVKLDYDPTEPLSDAVDQKNQ